jgi:hypothetical protein
MNLSLTKIEDGTWNLITFRYQTKVHNRKIAAVEAGWLEDQRSGTYLEVYVDTNFRFQVL